jgi:uncharacterized protein (DUF2147 family)
MMVRTVLAAMLTAASPGIAAGPADPSGTWRTDDGSARIRIERCGARREQICGYVVWIKQPDAPDGGPPTDQRNPDPAKRSRPVLGHQLIMGLTPDPDGHFAGRLYNAGNGKYVDISLWRETSDRLSLKGCMLSILCGTRTWLEASDVLPGQLTGATGEPNGPRADPEWARPAKPSMTAGAAR